MDICDDGRPVAGIAVDAAHSQKNRITEYRAVDLATGKEIFRKNLGNQTVNIGEFLGVVEAAKYILENSFVPKIIYSDSKTAITWFENKSTASTRRNRDLQKAEIFLKAMSMYLADVKVEHWSNREWGETPADFGNK